METKMDKQVLVAYASKYGATGEIAAEMQEKDLAPEPGSK
jgi:menaquinone-dependent protoporphyrinogen IX oxidase